MTAERSTKELLHAKDRATTIAIPPRIERRKRERRPLAGMPNVTIANAA
jgi:hypothetical protein